MARKKRNNDLQPIGVGLVDKADEKERNLLSSGLP